MKQIIVYILILIAVFGVSMIDGVAQNDCWDCPPSSTDDLSNSQSHTSQYTTSPTTQVVNIKKQVINNNGGASNIPRNPIYLSGGAYGYPSARMYNYLPQYYGWYPMGPTGYGRYYYSGYGNQYGYPSGGYGSIVVGGNNFVIGVSGGSSRYLQYGAGDRRCR